MKILFMTLLFSLLFIHCQGKKIKPPEINENDINSLINWRIIQNQENPNQFMFELISNDNNNHSTYIIKKGKHISIADFSGKVQNDIKFFKKDKFPKGKNTKELFNVIDIINKYEIKGVFPISEKDAIIIVFENGSYLYAKDKSKLDKKILDDFKHISWILFKDTYPQLVVYY